MTVWIALDTNVLAYGEQVGDETQCRLALELNEQIPKYQVFLPAPVLGALYRVLTGKAFRSPTAVRDALMGWSDSFEVADSTWTALQSALDLSVDHGMQIRDALILSIATENRCRALLSEDLQNGFTWRGVTEINPFAAPRPPRLDSLLATGSREP